MNSCRKAQLMEIADRYGIVVAEKSRKDELKETVLLSLFERVLVQAASLTFEQQKELLSLQFEQEKLRRHMEREERIELERLQQTGKLELEKMRQDNEKMKLEIKHTRLQLIREGKVSLWGSGVEDGASLGAAPGNLMLPLTCV